MSRYIDADALKEMIHYTDDFYETLYVEWEDIVLAPTVDAVPVVRCGECKNWEEKPLINGNGTRFGTCPLMMGLFFKSDFYCADGKRKEKENE